MGHGIGSEHPLCDRIQLVMLVLFLVVWGTDLLASTFLDYSTVLAAATTYPLLLLPSSAALITGVYLIAKSHKAVFGEAPVQPRLIDSGLYSWVRHPMYLGTLLLALAFFFASLSLLSFGVLIVFFILYDRMTVYEEKCLVEILGKDYIAYQKRVSKWFPRPH